MGAQHADRLGFALTACEAPLNPAGHTSLLVTIASGPRTVSENSLHGRGMVMDHLQLHALHVGLCEAGLVGAAAQIELVAVGAVADEPDLRHVRPRTAVGAPRHAHVHLQSPSA